MKKREDVTFEISNKLTISTPTATALINELVVAGLVKKRGRGKSVKGRKPDLYSLQNNSFFVSGIPMERSQTKMAAYDNDNRCVTEIQTFPLPIAKSQTALRQLFQCMQLTIKSSVIPIDKLFGISISMPGLVAAEEGKMTVF